MIYQAFQLSQDKKQIHLFSATCGLPISAIKGPFPTHLRRASRELQVRSDPSQHATAHNTWLTHPVGKEQAPKAMRCEAVPCARRDSAALPEPCWVTSHRCCYTRKQRLLQAHTKPPQLVLKHYQVAGKQFSRSLTVKL